MITRLRRATLNYFAALTISAGIVAVSASGSRRTQTPIVRIEYSSLVDGRWHPGEVLSADGDSVTVITRDGLTERSGLMLPN